MQAEVAGWPPVNFVLWVPGMAVPVEIRALL
jgi:hypothetical protein